MTAPKRIDLPIEWRFGEQPFDEAKLASSLGAAGADGDAIVVALPAVRIAFDAWDPTANDHVGSVFELQAASPSGFTVRELVRGMHESIAKSLLATNRRLGDHCIFEYLRLYSTKEMPMYYVAFGS